MRPDNIIFKLVTHFANICNQICIDYLTLYFYLIF